MAGRKGKSGSGDDGAWEAPRPGRLDEDKGDVETRLIKRLTRGRRAGAAASRPRRRSKSDRSAEAHFAHLKSNRVGVDAKGRAARTYHWRARGVSVAQRADGTHGGRGGSIDYVARQGDYADHADLEHLVGDPEMLRQALQTVDAAAIWRNGTKAERVAIAMILELPADADTERRRAAAMALVERWRAQGHEAIAAVHIHGQPHAHVLITARPVARTEAGWVVDRSTDRVPLRGYAAFKAERIRIADIINETCQPAVRYHPGRLRDTGIYRPAKKRIPERAWRRGQRDHAQARGSVEWNAAIDAGNVVALDAIRRRRQAEAEAAAETRAAKRAAVDAARAAQLALRRLMPQEPEASAASRPRRRGASSATTTPAAAVELRALTVREIIYAGDRLRKAGVAEAVVVERLEAAQHDADARIKLFAEIRAQKASGQDDRHPIPSDASTDTGRPPATTETSGTIPPPLGRPERRRGPDATAAPTDSAQRPGIVARGPARPPTYVRVPPDPNRERTAGNMGCEFDPERRAWFIPAALPGALQTAITAEFGIMPQPPLVHAAKPPTNDPSRPGSNRRASAPTPPAPAAGTPVAAPSTAAPSRVVSLSPGAVEPDRQALRDALRKLTADELAGIVRATHGEIALIDARGARATPTDRVRRVEMREGLLVARQVLHARRIPDPTKSRPSVGRGPARGPEL